jgi:hypothetical protein
MDVAVEMPELWPVVKRIRADGRLTGQTKAAVVNVTVKRRGNDHVM